MCAPLAAYWLGDGTLPLVVAFAFMAGAIGFIGLIAPHALALRFRNLGGTESRGKVAEHFGDAPLLIFGFTAGGLAGGAVRREGGHLSRRLGGVRDRGRAGGAPPAPA